MDRLICVICIKARMYFYACFLTMATTFKRTACIHEFMNAHNLLNTNDDDVLGDRAKLYGAIAKEYRYDPFGCFM